jgi:hypothetical protein
MKTMKLGVAALAAAGCLMTTSFAAAQAQAQAGGEVGMGLPQAAPQAGAVEGESDHDSMIGRLGVGYMGAFEVPLAAPGGQGPVFLPAPAVGIRYWLDQMIGLDVGLGIYTDGGNHTEDPGASVDKAGRTGVLVHAGVPLSLVSAGHFSFQLVPELNIGYAQQTEELPGGAGQDNRTGVGFEIGMRAGAEIQFGFIDIPQLSLQAGIGIGYRTAQIKEERERTGAPTTTSEDSTNVFATNVTGEPWDIFTGDVLRALYYF